MEANEGSTNPAKREAASEEKATKPGLQKASRDQTKEAPKVEMGTTLEVSGHKLVLDAQGTCHKVEAVRKNEPNRLDFLVGATFDLADDQN